VKENNLSFKFPVFERKKKLSLVLKVLKTSLPLMVGEKNSRTDILG
jgi:hypothetical protein